MYTEPERWLCIVPYRPLLRLLRLLRLLLPTLPLLLLPLGPLRFVNSAAALRESLKEQRNRKPQEDTTFVCEQQEERCAEH